MQMKHFISKIILAAAAIAQVSCNKTGSKELEQLLTELDCALEQREIYETRKQEGIRNIRAELAEAETPEKQYEIYDKLYDEYYQYHIDSAIFYANLKLRLARDARLEHRINDALMDIADRYVMSGMYTETTDILEGLSKRQLDWVEIPRQLHLYHALYEGLELQCDDPELKDVYKNKKNEYCRLLYDKLGDDDIAKVFVHADILYSENRSQDVLEELLEALDNSSDKHTKAILSYSIAKAYRMTDDGDTAMLWLARSAINDITTPVHEYRSLCELSTMLYDRGDIKRAYRYITCSLSDIMQADARINLQYINEIFPFIATSNNAQIKRENKTLWTTMAIILLVVLIICIAAGIVISDKRQIAAAEAELRIANERLERYINRLQEANNIKETYIGQYMDFCSNYIGNLDNYRRSLGKTLKTAGEDGLKKELRSTDLVKAELEEFYSHFDKTFLSLFPTFVEQLNELLQPEKRIQLKNGEGTLTTELRIFALLRLGVTDSSKIAEFLRRSVTTIYNYRVKMRNAALNNREDLEKQIMKIK